MFYIVEFLATATRGPETAVVPDFWYQGGLCSWPNTLDPVKSARTRELPGIKWKKYEARILKGFGKCFTKKMLV